MSGRKRKNEEDLDGDYLANSISESADSLIDDDEWNPSGADGKRKRRKSSSSDKGDASTSSTSTNGTSVARVKPNANGEYVCDVCNEKFARKRQLQDHLTLHTGELPYECRTCGKRYRVWRSWFDHEQTHTKPFHCDECPKQFAQQSQLKRHKLTHSDVKPYPCRFPNCTKEYRDKRTLVNHMRKKHPDWNDSKLNLLHPNNPNPGKMPSYKTSSKKRSGKSTAARKKTTDSGGKAAKGGKKSGGKKDLDDADILDDLERPTIERGSLITDSLGIPRHRQQIRSREPSAGSAYSGEDHGEPLPLLNMSTEELERKLFSSMPLGSGDAVGINLGASATGLLAQGRVVSASASSTGSAANSSGAHASSSTSATLSTRQSITHLHERSLSERTTSSTSVGSFKHYLPSTAAGVDAMALDALESVNSNNHTSANSSSSSTSMSADSDMLEHSNTETLLAHTTAGQQAPARTAFLFNGSSSGSGDAANDDLAQIDVSPLGDHTVSDEFLQPAFRLDRGSMAHCLYCGLLYTTDNNDTAFCSLACQLNAVTSEVDMGAFDGSLFSV